MTAPLDGIDLVVFDKDGTLIGFGTMWNDWAEALGRRLSLELGHDVRTPLFEMLGYDPHSGIVAPHGGLAATPMARLRELTLAVLIADGVPMADAEAALARAWHAPDPETRALPLADLRALFDDLRADGRKVAIATSDDRVPTERTLAALDLADRVDATICADDGLAVKPAPDMVERLCAICGVEPSRTAVIGDAPADMAMGRAAGAALVIGVLTGVGGQAELEPLADRVIGSVEQLRAG